MFPIALDSYEMLSLVTESAVAVIQNSSKDILCDHKIILKKTISILNL